MKVVFLAALVCLVKSTAGAGAGRAYPIATENFVVDLFQGVNRNIQWDKTNFLVDLSGNYANCDYINRQGFLEVDRKMPDGRAIMAIIDSTYGDETHTNAVDGYIRPVMQRWIQNNDYIAQIRAADLFACSNRPGCNGRVSVACLFTPSISAPIVVPTPRPTRPWTPRPVTPPRPRPTTPPTRPPITGEQVAKAFTPEQYRVAEQITEQAWDRSHLLENLSGYETNCSIVGRTRWDFDISKAIAEQRGFEIVGLFGYQRNIGSTPDALEIILREMKEDAISRPLSSQANIKLRDFFGPRQSGAQSEGVGCSLIPDCLDRNNVMYVVVACVFEV